MLTTQMLQDTQRPDMLHNHLGKIILSKIIFEIVLQLNLLQNFHCGKTN